ncbi:MAG: TM2 domain-containing protein [Gemmatimonadales bacterium]
MNEPEISDRSRAVAIALVTVTGMFGGHRFYAGKIGTGILQLLTAGGMGIWWLYDWILVLTGSFRDVDGRRIVNWAEGPVDARRRISGERMDMLLDELETLRTELGELDERVDFMERVLSQVRDRGAIPQASGSP